MSKKLSIVVFVVILFVFVAYLYSSYGASSKEQIANTPQTTHEPRVVAKEAKKASDNTVKPVVFKPISESVPVPKLEPEIEPEVGLSWKEEQALHQAEIDRLNSLQENFHEDSDEYREIEEKILIEFQDMGMDVFQIRGGGGAMFTPDYRSLNEISKRFDPELQSRFAAEISAVENLINQREKINAEKNANRRGELENTPELIERDQKLVAQEFRFAREHDHFFEELNEHADD